MVATMVAGCSDDTDLDRPTAPNPQGSISNAAELRRPGEDFFRSLSDRIPAFGGFYFAGDELVVLTTDHASRAALAGTLRPFLDGRFRRPGQAPGTAVTIRFEEAEHSFKELAAWRDAAWNATLALPEVDSNNPVLLISDFRQKGFVGEIAEKIGQKTGWTWGPITKTCADKKFDDEKRVCQQWVDARIDGGDSGSPVFLPVADGTIIPQGVAWTVSDNQFIYSPLEGIENDLGNLDLTLEF